MTIEHDELKTKSTKPKAFSFPHTKLFAFRFLLLAFLEMYVQRFWLLQPRFPLQIFARTQLRVFRYNRVYLTKVLHLSK